MHVEGSGPPAGEHNHVRTIVAVVLAALTAVALSACGSANSTTTVTAAKGTASASTSSSTNTTTTSPTTSTASTSSASTSGSATPLCTASRLELTYLGGQGATGHGELGFELRNTGSSSCHTYGFPGVLFLDRAGGALPTASTRTTQDFFGSTPKVELVLAPGESASFRLGVTHGMTSTAGCTTAYGLQVIPPDDTATLRTPIANGAYECGTATVSPLRPGTSAYP
jgi:uncharacterized protein DUF4232